jgi:hypothetical protein
VLCLRILQAALVYVNTLMIQDLLAEPEWADALTAEDQRGLTPLFWSHVLPYGEVKLNMTSRLPLSTAQADRCVRFGSLCVRLYARRWDAPGGRASRVADELGPARQSIGGQLHAQSTRIESRGQRR